MKFLKNLVLNLWCNLLKEVSINIIKRFAFVLINVNSHISNSLFLDLQKYNICRDMYVLGENNVCLMRNVCMWSFSSHYVTCIEIRCPQHLHFWLIWRKSKWTYAIMNILFYLRSNQFWMLHHDKHQSEAVLKWENDNRDLKKGVSWYPFLRVSQGVSICMHVHINILKIQFCKRHSLSYGQDP